MTHVAYKGGAPAAQDLIGGQIPVMIDTASETLENHKTGKLKIVAVTGETPSVALPDVAHFERSWCECGGRCLLWTLWARQYGR